jgi:proline iminopeptidase
MSTLLRVLATAALFSVVQALVIVGLIAAGARPQVALAGSFVAVAGAAGGWVRWRGPRFGAAPWRRWVVLVAMTVTLSGAAYLLPRTSPGTPVLAGGEVIRLGDGTEVVVRRYEPADAVDVEEPPVVLVHGGPGVPFSPVEEATLARLATTRTMVSFDQVGVGDSSRLQEPSGYTLQRAADDLAAVVAATTEAEPVLLGHSWGALVALTYAAQHPDTVAGLVFTSPGPFPWRDRAWPVVAPQDRLDTGDRVRLQAAALEPRNFFVWALTAVDADAAHWFAGDAEMDRRFVGIYRLAQPGLTCDGRRNGPPSGLGYFAAQVPQLHPDGSGVTPDQLRRLATLPVLVVRGECDYVEPGIARTWASELSGRLVELDDAGHSIAEEAPTAVLVAIEAFLGRIRPEMLDRDRVRSGGTKQ